MFLSARIKLTAWYLLIIMLVCLIFSFAIYNQIDRELQRIERVQNLRVQEEELFGIPPDEANDPALAVEDARNRLIVTLGLINLGILVASGFAGYFLAGRTLAPIEEMLSEQNRFVTDASHELRTPLTSLKASIEVNMRNKNLTAQQARELLKSNLEEVNTLHALSDELIQLAQFQKVKGTFGFSEVALQDILDHALRTIEPVAKQKKITISKIIENVSIQAEEKSLTELFTILLDNAVKYTSKGGAIRIESRKIDGHVEVVVKDTGIGIEEKHIPFIFDRFYRADTSRTKKNAPGYGLGLSIAKKIVHMHDGSIQVKSQKGSGSTFTVELPVRQGRHVFRPLS